MAGANNAQMKSQGFKKAQIVAMRAARPGPLTIAKAERTKVQPVKAEAPAGWQSAARKAQVAKGAPGWNAAAKNAANRSGAPGWKAAADAARAKGNATQPPPGWAAAAQRAKNKPAGAPGLAQKAAAAVAARPGKLKLTPGNYTWKRGADGNYSASDGRAKLEKTGKSWALVMRDGSRHPLGKKASFDHAEQAMARLGAR